MATEAESKQLRDLMDKGDELIEEIKAISVIGPLAVAAIGAERLKNDIYDIIYSGTKDLAIATDATVAQQLDAGIRYLDLRIYLKSDGAYTHHTLAGTPINDIMNSVRSFLSRTSGEILIVQMSHFIVDDNSKMDDLFFKFADDLSHLLGVFSYLPMKDTQGNATNPAFQQTYNAVFSQSPEPGSRVILIMDGAPIDVSQFLVYWTPSQLGVSGKYSNTTDRTYLITDQSQKYTNAKNSGTPFALSLTLTPQPSDCQLIVINKVATELPAKIIPFLKDIPGGTAAVDKVIKKWLNGYIWNGDWSTLKQLSQKIDSDLDHVLVNNFQSATSGNNYLTIIFADFFETTLLVETAIRYSRLPTSN
jgi:hypothetical protein